MTLARGSIESLPRYESDGTAAPDHSGEILSIERVFAEALRDLDHALDLGSRLAPTLRAV
jgi:hypothetical protein